MTSSLEDIKTIDLEEWLSLATAPAPTKLKQGQTPNMKNVWVDEKPGSIITSNGFVKVGSSPSGNPTTFCINYFKTSTGTQTFVLSDNATVWTTVDFQNFTSIITGLSASFQLRGLVIRDKLWLTNGSDAVRVFDGSTVTTLSGTSGTAVIQAITYSSAGTLYSPTSITIAYTSGGTAGSETVTVTGSAISVQIQSGVSTATQVLAKINASASALALVSASITGTAGSAQTTQTATALSGGTPNAPHGRFIAYHDERVWLYHTSTNRSAGYFSSLTDAGANIINPDDPSAWDTTDNFLQISQGDADFGTGMILYRGYLFFFKQYSIWRLVGYDEYTYSKVKTRASTGTRFNESVQILDSLVHLIGVDGIYVFDGEESERISDLIDPSTASQTSFGFNQLQQPNTNNQFYEVTATADWNTGTVPANLTIDNSATLRAADDSQAEFQAGVTKTNIDTVLSPGFIQLSLTSAGVSSNNIASNKAATFYSSGGSGTVGAASFATDGNLTNLVGVSSGNNGLDLGYISITLPSGTNCTTIVLKQFQVVGYVRFEIDGNIITPTALSDTTHFRINTGVEQFAMGHYDITISCNVFSGSTFKIFAATSSGSFTLTEIQIYTAAYNSTGKFASRTLDLGGTPASLGTFSANVNLNSQTLSYFTQSSADGSSWDGEVSCTNGGAIGSTARRYLRWGANFNSDGNNTPTIDAAYLPAVFLSAVHNTGGSIFAWGPFESDYSLLAQTISFYYRTATTSLGVASATWNLIVPGGVISDAVSHQYVQFKFEVSGGLSTKLPVVSNVTINWVTGSGIQQQTLQNVASTYWRNRYWLSAASAGATANDTIIVRGKKTFQSPWMLKDFNILSFTRFQDSLYGGSSTNGDLYLIDSGYSKAGLAMDSYFETGDFVFGGFTANLLEIDIEVERVGSWDLSVGVSVDGGKTFDDYSVNLAMSTYDSNYITKINVSYTTTRFRLRFRTNGVDTPFQVHRCVIFYKLASERGSIIGDYQ